jgi:hypothetical protein
MLKSIEYLELWLVSRDGALDKTVRVGLRSIDLGVLAGVLETLMPAKVDLEIVLVWQGVGDVLDLGELLEDRLAHVVHGSLDRCRVLESEGLEGDVSSAVVGVVEHAVLGELLDLAIGGDLGAGPHPGRVDVGGEDSVVGLWKGGVLALVVRVEHGAGGLEDGQVLDTGLDLEWRAVVTLGHGDETLFLAVSHEGVRVRLALDVESGPTMLDDVNVGGVDMWVAGDEVVGDGSTETLNWPHLSLLGQNVDGVLDGVGWNDWRVVSMGVRLLNVALQKTAHSQLNDVLVVSVVWISPHLQNTDIVLTVSSSRKRTG